MLFEQKKITFFQLDVSKLEGKVQRFQKTQRSICKLEQIKLNRIQEENESVSEFQEKKNSEFKDEKKS